MQKEREIPSAASIPIASSVEVEQAEVIRCIGGNEEIKSLVANQKWYHRLVFTFSTSDLSGTGERLVFLENWKHLQLIASTFGELYRRFHDYHAGVVRYKRQQDRAAAENANGGGEEKKQKRGRKRRSVNPYDIGAEDEITAVAAGSGGGPDAIQAALNAHETDKMTAAYLTFETGVSASNSRGGSSITDPSVIHNIRMRLDYLDPTKDPTITDLSTPSSSSSSSSDRAARLAQLQRSVSTGSTDEKMTAGKTPISGRLGTVMSKLFEDMKKRKDDLASKRPKRGEKIQHEPFHQLTDVHHLVEAIQRYKPMPRRPNMDEVQFYPLDHPKNPINMLDVFSEEYGIKTKSRGILPRQLDIGEYKTLGAFPFANLVFRVMERPDECHYAFRAKVFPWSYLDQVIDPDAVKSVERMLRDEPSDVIAKEINEFRHKHKTAVIPQPGTENLSVDKMAEYLDLWLNRDDDDHHPREKKNADDPEVAIDPAFDTEVLAALARTNRQMQMTRRPNYRLGKLSKNRSRSALRN